MNSGIEQDVNIYKCFEPVLNSPKKFVTVQAPRRTGKTYAVAQGLDFRMKQAPRRSGLWIDTTYNNIAQYIDRYFKQLNAEIIDGKPDYTLWYERFKYDRKYNVLTYPNGSYIDFRSITKPSSMEGWEYDYGVLNEAGIILEKSTVWESTIRPLFKNGKRVIIIGTPKGLNSFYDLSQTDSEEWENHHIKALDSPRWTAEELQEIRNTSRDYQIYRQEYEAEFVEGGDAVIVKPEARTNDTYRNPDTNKDWTLDDDFIKIQLSRDTSLFVGIDDGAKTTHPAAVLGFHCFELKRDIVIKEFTDYTSSQTLSQAIRDFIDHHQLLSISNNNYEVVADPSLNWTANKVIYKEVLGKLNMLEWMRTSSNPQISRIWSHRLIERTDNLGIITKARCADGLPKLIIIKGSEKGGKYDFGCPDLYRGIFKGRYRWSLNKAGIVERGVLDQLPYITDVCDALTYYLLHKYIPL